MSFWCLIRRSDQASPNPRSTSTMISPSWPSGRGDRADGSGSIVSPRSRTCSGSICRGNGNVPTLRATGTSGSAPARGFEPTRQHQVPQVALECREVKRPQFAAQPGEGAAVVGRMVDQVGHDASGRRTRQDCLRLRPMPPVSPQQCLLGLHRGAVERVRLGQRESQGSFGFAAQPGVGHELTRVAHGPESLIVEIIRKSRLSGSSRSARWREPSSPSVSPRSTSSNRLPLRCFRCVCMIQTTDRLELVLRGTDGTSGPIGNRQILDGRSRADPSSLRSSLVGPTGSSAGKWPRPPRWCPGLAWSADRACSVPARLAGPATTPRHESPQASTSASSWTRAG